MYIYIRNLIIILAETGCADDFVNICTVKRLTVEKKECKRYVQHVDGQTEREGVRLQECVCISKMKDKGCAIKHVLRETK